MLSLVRYMVQKQWVLLSLCLWYMSEILRIFFGDRLHNSQGLWKIKSHRELKMLKEIFNVDNFNSFIFEIDDQCIFHRFEILNPSLAWRWHNLPLKLASSLMNFERIVRSWLVLKNWFTIVKINLKAALYEKVPDGLHISLEIQNFFTQLNFWNWLYQLFCVKLNKFNAILKLYGNKCAISFNINDFFIFSRNVI